MKDYIVITENDESEWNDKTGVLYHFPPKYRNIIKVGSILVYYKGKIKDSKYQSKRLSNEPHYFGTGIITEIFNDSNSKNLFARISNFKLFNEAVNFKDKGLYLEEKANNISHNYFRGNAVRRITEEEYKNIISKSDFKDHALVEAYTIYDKAHETSVVEGKKVAIYTTKYERNKSNRDQALKMHGYSCCVCNINFKDTYGEIGEGFIHIHHIKPLYSLEEETLIDPATDLVPVCPNCHAMIHRKKNTIISIEELKSMFKKSNTN